MANANVNANVLTANTDISLFIPVPNRNTASQRFVQTTLKASVLGLPGEGVQPPELDNAALAKIQSDATLSTEQRIAAIDKAVADYRKQLADWQKLGNVASIDLIAPAVVKYLIEHEGFTSEKGEQAPYISASDLSVTLTPQGSYMVTGSAVWGELLATLTAEQIAALPGGYAELLTALTGIVSPEAGEAH